MSYPDVEIGILPNVIYDDEDKRMSEVEGVYSIYEKEYAGKTLEFKLKLKSRHSTLEQATKEYFPEQFKGIANKATPNKLKSIMERYSIVKTQSDITKK